MDNLVSTGFVAALPLTRMATFDSLVFYVLARCGIRVRRRSRRLRIRSPRETYRPSTSCMAFMARFLSLQAVFRAAQGAMMSTRAMTATPAATQVPIILIMSSGSAPGDDISLGSIGLKCCRDVVLDYSCCNTVDLSGRLTSRLVACAFDDLVVPSDCAVDRPTICQRYCLQVVLKNKPLSHLLSNRFAFRRAALLCKCGAEMPLFVMCKGERWLPEGTRDREEIAADPVRPI